MNTTKNTLYPIFLKLHQLHVLIVGGGAVGLEKLSFMLKNSPDARVTLVAREVSSEVRELAGGFPKVTLLERGYLTNDLHHKNLVIAATNDRKINEKIRSEAHHHNILVNVADTPDLCDFYLGSIVTRGDLKVAVSTNGKSPTFAKRFRQVLEEILPDDTNLLLANLHQIRNQLKGNFSEKVRQLNQLTSGLITQTKSTHS